jgi:hypothetical protein
MGQRAQPMCRSTRIAWAGAPAGQLAAVPVAASAPGSSASRAPAPNQASGLPDAAEPCQAQPADHAGHWRTHNLLRTAQKPSPGSAN